MANENDYSKQNNTISDGSNMPSDEHNDSYMTGYARSGMELQNESPIDTSVSDLLSANKGNYVIIEFSIGTSSLVDKEGFLYDSGVNFVTIYDPIDDKYIICDLYSLKFVTVYTTPPPGTMMRTTSARQRNYPTGIPGGVNVTRR